MKCFNCDSENVTDSVFCANCGTKLTSPADLCPQCRSPLPPDVNFCYICGTRIPDKNTANVAFYGQPVPMSGMKKKHKIWIGALTVLLIVVITAFTTAKLAGRPGDDNQDGETSHDASTKIPENTSSATKYTDKETTAFVITDENLIGLWSTEGPAGELVDPDTGYATGSIYNGTWYLFRDDGTYRYVIIGSGDFISGGVVCEGYYSVSSGKIYLTDVKESWYPDPAKPGQEAAYKGKKGDDQTLYYRFTDGVDTLNIDELNYFHRVAGYN